MAEESNLFKKLTSLFRSGPVVRRRVKQFSGRSTSRSSLEIFKKAHSDVYNSTLSAYGSYDRMARYSDFSEMEACISGDTLIATPDGYTEIQELAKQYGPDETFIVYAYDHEKKQIVPALGKQARRTVTEMSYKITFDSGKTLIATPDHRVMRRDGTYCEVQHLKSGDSMMPFYRKALFDKDKDSGKGYQWIYTMNKEDSTLNNGWMSEHRVIAEWVANRKIKNSEHVHHKNFIRHDNRPENLQIMDAKEHLAYHTNILNGKKWDYKENSEWIENFKKNHSKFMKENNPAERKDVTFAKILQVCDRDGYNWLHLQRVFDCSSSVITNRLRDAGFNNFTSFAKAYDPNWKNNGWNNKGNKNPRYDKTLTYQKICDAFKEGITCKDLAVTLNTTSSKINNRIKNEGFKNFTEFKRSFGNHKVVSVEPYKTIDLYDLTVDGYKNYATDSIIVHNTPEISSALDIYAEECVSPDVEGLSLHIYSENRMIKQLLNELFYDVLNIDFNLVMWVRNLCKYGDFFLFNDIHPEYGVINCFPIPIAEIEREEGFDPDDPAAVRFRWVTQGNRVLENWQVSHLRLLGNDAFLPYGASVLEGARRIWRQLILIEDAMLVYRVIRSPERRVFYIDVGNIPPENVADYLEQAQTALKRNAVVDKSTGQVDLRYNPLPVWKDTPIPLLDGRTITIEELSKEAAEGKDTWVYSIQDDTHQIVPGKVTWCGKNYTAERMIKVWLDNDTFVMTAPEHPFVMRDGTSKRADELNEGDSLMPLYRKLSNVEDGDWIKDYEKTYNPATEKFEYTHKLSADDKYSATGGYSVKTRRVIHHIDYNKHNNEPTNLQEMSYTAHRKYHAEHCQYTLNTPERLAARRVKRIAYNKSSAKRIKTAEDNRKYQKAQKMNAIYNGSELHKEHNEIRRTAQLKSWAENKERRSSAMKMVLPQECVDIAINILQNDPSLNRDRLFEAVHKLDDFRNAWEAANSHNNRKYERYGSRTFAYQIKEFGYSGFNDFKKQSVSEYRNHKVLRIEEVFEPDDVYCMTVVGPHGEDDRHNFAVLGINKDGDHDQSGVFVLNSVDEDYFLPVRGGESGTRIDTLAGGSNTTAIEDVEYIQKKLFAALKIPKAYLGYDEDIGAKATLAQEDIRFSRTIQRIQKTIVAELNKIAMIHLYTHGYTEESLLDFELKLSNPSSIAQQQKLELIRTKFEIASQAPEGIVDREWLRKHILDLNDDEIKRIEDGKEKDKLRDMELENVKLPTDNQFLFGDESEEGGAEDFGGDVGGDDFGGGDEGGGDEGGGLEGLFAGEMKSGKLMSEDELSEYDNLLDEDDEVSEDAKEKAKSSKGANVSKESRGKYNINKDLKVSLSAQDTGLHATGSMGALKGPDVIKASDLMDGIMPQSPVIEKFVDKQISYRMTKSLDDMSKALNIGNTKNKVLTESNSSNDDILIDDDIFENEDQ